MEDFNRIASLLRKFRTHAIREDEVHELRDWLEGKENRELFKQVMRGEREVHVMRELKKYDREVAFQRFTGRVHPGKRRIRYYARLAAAVVLPIVLGMLVYWRVETLARKVMPVVEIVSLTPGQKKAILTFDDGSKMGLGDAIEGKIVLNEGVCLKIDSTGLRYNFKEASEVIKMNELFVPRKGEYNLTLSDGTRVFLNSDSKLTYPVAFGDGQREVILEGEAYFDVVKDEKRPFVVKTGDLSVRVLGTAFNVKNYPGDLRLEATLVRGRVKILEGDQEMLLEPGEQARLDRSSGKMNKMQVNTALYTSWKDGLFIFERERLEDILTTLARWYDVNIFYQCSTVKDELFTGDLKKYENINEHLKMLEMTTDVKFEIHENTITVK